MTIVRRDGRPRNRNWSSNCWLACAAVLLALPARAQTVVDGDTIRLDGTTYNLFGIDAAETRQVCSDGWPAGHAAIDFLNELIKKREIVCESVASDRHGRAVAVCTADGKDLAAAMVSAGMAWALAQRGANYLNQEAQANLDRLGIHAHGCAPAWEWAAQQRGSN